MADKQKIVAQLEIDIGNAEQSLQRLQGLGKEGLLGKKGAKESNMEIQSLVQKLGQLKAKVPGINSGEKEFNQFYSAVKKTTSEVQKCLGKMSGFEVTDDVIKKNVSEIQQYVTQVKNLSSQLTSLQRGVKGTKLSSYATVGEKRDSQRAESAMRTYAEKGETEQVKAAGDKRIGELKQKRSGLDKKSDVYTALTQDIKTLEAAQKSYISQSEQISAAMQENASATKILSDAMERPRQEIMETQQTIQRESLEIKNNLQNAENGAYEMGQSFEQLRQSSNSIGEIGDQLMYLFSVTSIFYAVRRVVSDVIEDFKELDKQFNEIAIVSDKSTQEMWDQFSSVNEIAQKFGVTTANVLEVQNLYYHQGKSSAEVTKLTAQTLTLAKITGMDYARATSDLTAALNAYNMKAEEAVRVTDTIAAMDTNAAISSEELMTALTKTASIAANAGMSLESTEIFLTKMIETTREAPENLGTALKTIIARFGEVKEEIDGEAIELADINRVDTALKTVGITLLDTTGQIRDLDEVFLELSAKWDDLDRNTQRYIATIAAGSRQQSRFIAMMEDYDRTLELTEAMNNSAGIGARQLRKSMESIETSINTLKSSWQELTQKFLKNKMITGFLNSLNKILDVINELPAPIIAVGVALGAWALKVKVLDKAMLTHKIIQDGLIRGLDEETIARNINTAMRTKDRGILKTYVKILREAAIEETKSAAAIATATQSKMAEIIANEKLSAQQKQLLLEQALGIGAEDKEKQAILETAIAELAKIETIEELIERYGEASLVLAAYNLLLKDNTRELNENSLSQAVNAGATKKNTGSKGTNGLMNLFSGKGDKDGKGLLAGLGKVGAAITKFIPYLLIIAAVLAAIYAAWKLFFEASKNDTKKIEALAEAQENYNNSLQKYKSLKEKANKLEKIQSSGYKTLEQREEEQTIIQELVEEYPTLLDYIDEEGNYHLKNAGAIKEEILQQKELMKQNQATYNAARASQANMGIYGDESTAAGKNISQLQDYYGSFDKDGLKALAKSIDEFGLDFSQTEFKKLAEAYGSGEKFSFNYKDFNNLFAGSAMTEKSFQEVSEEYKKQLEQGEDVYTAMKNALEKSSDYSYEIQEKIAKAWFNLNEQTGNIYSDLLTNIETELDTLYVKEAKIFIDEQTEGSNLSEEFKNELAEIYAANKEQIMQEYRDSYDAYTTGQVIATNLSHNLFTIPSKISAGDWGGVLDTILYELAETIFPVDLIPLIEREINKNSNIANKEREATAQSEAEYTDFLQWLSKPEVANIANKGLEAALSLPYGDQTTVTTTNLGLLNSGLEEDKLAKLLSLYQSIIDKKKEEIETFKKELGDGASFFNDKTFTFQEYDVIIEKYNSLGKEAGEAYAAGLEMIKSTHDKNLKEDYLALNASSLSDVSKYLEKAKDSAELTKGEFQELEKDMFKVAYASGAIHFGDVIAEAEELTDRFENLANAFEGFIKLAYGEGDFTGLSNYINTFIDTIDDFSTFETKMNSIVTSGKSTLDGIKVGDSLNNAKIMLEQQQELIIYELRLLQGQLDIAETDEERKRILADMTLYRFAYGEAEAEYQRQLQDAEVERLEKSLELLEKTRDRLKEYVEWLRSFDIYTNLNRSIEQLERDQGHLEFEVDFLLDPDAIKNSMEENLNNINTQIAANQAGLNTANNEAAMWRDVIQKRNSEYVSFGEDGTAIVDTSKLQDLQNKIANTTNEAEREKYKADYDEIMANVDAYKKAQDAAENYTKALEGNLKALEDFLKGTYENIKKVEDKLIEVRMAQEDKELQAVKDKYDAIKEENDKYLESVRDMIDKERKIRDRANSEQDVKDKEKKLAMMKMDTSGVYARDIQALEKELSKDYQSLEDDAVDAALDEMEQKYDKQAELYDKDVQYMENALQYKREKMTEYNEWATQLLEQGSDAVLAYLKANDEEYYTGTAAAQALWEQEWNSSVAQAVASNELLQTSLLETVKDALEQCKTGASNFEDAVIQYSDTAVVKNGTVQSSVDELTTHFETLAGGVDGVTTALGDLEIAYRNAAVEAKNLADWQSKTFSASPYTGKVSGISPSTITTTTTQPSTYGAFKTYDFKTVTSGSKNARYSEGMGWTDHGRFEQTLQEIAYDDGKYYAKLDGRWVVLDNDNVEFKDGGKNVVLTPTLAYELSKDAELYGNYKKNKKYRVKESAIQYKYATGGLADFTGPAWLDGTTKKPEAVLNALQTKHFIQFVDVLDTLFKGAPHFGVSPQYQAQKSGDATYNFHINVDKMTDDYDVDQMIKRIEEKIAKSNQYRSVTVVKKTN